jgi:hypothetical protein
MFQTPLLNIQSVVYLVKEIEMETTIKRKDCWFSGVEAADFGIFQKWIEKGLTAKNNNDYYGVIFCRYFLFANGLDWEKINTIIPSM